MDQAEDGKSELDKRRSAKVDRNLEEAQKASEAFSIYDEEKFLNLDFEQAKRLHARATSWKSEL